MRGEYPTAGWVSLFMLLAMAVESRAAAGAHAAIEALVRLAPERAARVNVSGAEEQVRAADLALGDRIRVPGRYPARGWRHPRRPDHA